MKVYLSLIKKDFLILLRGPLVSVCTLMASFNCFLNFSIFGNGVLNNEFVHFSNIIKALVISQLVFLLIIGIFFSIDDEKSHVEYIYQNWKLKKENLILSRSMSLFLAGLIYVFCTLPFIITLFIHSSVSVSTMLEFFINSIFIDGFISILLSIFYYAFWGKRIGLFVGSAISSLFFFISNESILTLFFNNSIPLISSGIDLLEEVIIGYRSLINVLFILISFCLCFYITGILIIRWRDKI